MAAAPVKNKELSSLGALFYTQAIPLGLHIGAVRVRIRGIDSVRTRRFSCAAVPGLFSVILYRTSVRRVVCRSSDNFYRAIG